MKKYWKNLLNALACFLVVIVLNFALPRLLPGNPIAYLTGFSEEEMTEKQIEFYRGALHLDDTLPRQFLYYLGSIADGTLGYSFKKEAAVSALIRSRIGCTLQITLPAVTLSSVIGLSWGLFCGYRKESLSDKLSTGFQIVLNTVPSFLIALAAVILLCFRRRLFPYTGISSPGMVPGAPGFFADRIRHLALPVLTLTLAVTPSRFLLMRNTAARLAGEKYILYAKQRGLSPRVICFGYLLKNIAAPFITMLGMSVSLCIGGSLVIENIFSIGGMGKLLTDAVYTLDYPLMQGILFVTTLIMTLSIIATDILCILIDPKVRLGEGA
ncbi:MAG: ABC transporter permease [Oscillospiraceae bacterium]|nr:ABC transporter permease [Oscillospiraceae bacterium]